jgi:hypothetical protein
MTKITEKVFDHLLPPAEELWERGGATMVAYGNNDGSIEDRPFFDLEITNTDSYKKPIESDDFITRSGRKIGRKVLHQIDVNGIDHLVRAYIPNGNGNDSDLTITSGAAWFTTIKGGYAEDRSNKLFADNSQAVLQVGPPHSGQELPGPFEWLRVPETVDEAYQTSLARTAQIEQYLFATVSDLYGLSKNQLAIGDSRDSMTTPGQYLYAPQYDANIVAFDTKARCAINRLEMKDLPQFGTWALTTLVGGIAVSVCMAKEGQLHVLSGTSSLNPNFMASTLTGTLRSLASGEAGTMIGWVPKDAAGIDILYGHDSMSNVDEVRDAWNGHPDVYVKLVRGGTHASLLHPLAHTGRRQRTKDTIQAYKANNGRLTKQDLDRIYGGHKPTMLPKVA